MPKMENGLPKVTAELGLEFEYLKPLLFSFHCFDDFDPSKLIKLANLPLFNIPPSSPPPCLKDIAKISVKKKKTPRKYAFCISLQC